jgi:signal peptidase I
VTPERTSTRRQEKAAEEKAAEDKAAGKAKASWRSNSLVELVLIVVVALGLALGIQAFLVKPYRIPSESMVPTLAIGQRVLVNRLGNNFGDPQIGDVTVFHPPKGSENGTCGTNPNFDPEQQRHACTTPSKEKADVNFIKRIVAKPGDTLAVEDGHVIRNGKRQREPFIAPCDGGGGCNLPKPITIPKDHYFMMGDNRGHSEDSRFWGPVPRDWIIGNAFATYWPPKRIGFL